jgi:hypothetical protein
MSHIATADPCPGFDFQTGTWRVRHRRLKSRLTGCQLWDEFEGTCEARPLLGGYGNIEDNWLDLHGGAWRAVALRSFDPASGTWAIWWLDGRAPHTLDAPLIGGFKDGVGTFFVDDLHDGRPIKLRFLWLRTGTETPHWEQAMSDDGGETWETNWTMDFERY